MTAESTNTNPSITNPSITALHRQALNSTRAFVAGITSTQWSNPTPCDDWDVRSLVNHIVVGNLWAAELAAGRGIHDVGDRLDGDHLGALPLESYDQSAKAAAEAFEAPGALDAPCSVSYGPIPGSVYAGHRFVDVLIHGWDIAIATGQMPALAQQLVDACWDVINPQLSDLQSSGMFGSPETSAATDPQLRLLETLGRRTSSSKL